MASQAAHPTKVVEDLVRLGKELAHADKLDAGSPSAPLRAGKSGMTVKDEL